MRRVRIGTRGSRLAVWQAEHVAGLLQERHDVEVEIRTIRTTGDRVRDRPLADVGGKGLFLKEIEEALLAGQVDLAVHSLKDVPAEMAPGCVLGAVLERREPHDALCLPRSGADDRPARGDVTELLSDRPPRGDAAGLPDHPPARGDAAELLDGLPHGARVGTGSARRATQLLARRPDLRVEGVRGNVDTRVQRLDEGRVDALVLAVAGLERLGLDGRVDGVFAAADMVPAVGQGALCIEARDGDGAARRLAVTLEDGDTRTVIDAERAFMAAVGGGCKVPMAAHGRLLPGGDLELTGLVGDGRGAMVRKRARGPRDTAVELGRRLAARVLDAGGSRLLATMTAPGEAAGR